MPRRMLIMLECKLKIKNNVMSDFYLAYRLIVSVHRSVREKPHMLGLILNITE